MLHVYQDILYFSGETNASGLELFYYNGTYTNYTRDINRGYRPSVPTGFFPINDTIYFTARNKYYGRELWYLKWEECDDPNDNGYIIPCDITCTFDQINSTGFLTIIGGDVRANSINVYGPLIIEGDLFQNGVINCQSNLTILGSAFFNSANSAIIKTFGSTIMISHCIILGPNVNNIKIEIIISDENATYLQQHQGKNISIIEAPCMVGNFFNLSTDTIILKVDSKCKQVSVVNVEQQRDGLYASFQVNDLCEANTIVVLVVISICIVLGLVIIAIVLMVNPKTRNKIFPQNGK